MARKIRLLNPRCAGGGHKGCNEKFRVNFDRVDTISRRIIKQRGGVERILLPLARRKGMEKSRERRDKMEGDVQDVIALPRSFLRLKR